MTRLFSPLLPYAETHFKFKLPWSPLYRRWPEIFLDGPSFCVPGETPRFYLFLKDADYFPVTVREVETVLQCQGQFRKHSWGPSGKTEANFSCLPIDLPFEKLSGWVSINARITVENARGRTRTFINSNFPGLAPSPLGIRLLTSPLPYAPGWQAGEMHCHSDYSNDPVEYGAPLAVLQEAARCLGMGFVMCTDHSYDFYYRKTRYMEPTDPEENFQAYRREALALNRPGHPVMVPGEEVSCANGKGENVHLLVAGHDKFLPGLGDGGRRWFNNKPDLSIAEVLERLGTTPCFAAHPRVRVGALERAIFRRGLWWEEDLQSGKGRSIDGLQFWNGHRGADFAEGKAFWVRQLLAGRRLHPIGANDAHGDLNRNIGVKLPLFSLYQGRNHVFGNVRTLVRVSGADASVAGIQAGLRDRVICTDGPFLELDWEGDALRITAAGSSDFGGLEKVALIMGRRGERQESVAREWSWKDAPLHFSERVDAPAGALYLRAETRTREGKWALTSPLFP